MASSGVGHEVVIHRMFAGLAQQAAVDDAGDGRLTLDGLFRAHADDVHRIVRRLMGPGATEADLDDVVQLVFLAVHRALPKFRGESKTSTWIYGITARTVLHHLRGRRRYRAMMARLEEQPWPVERLEPRLESRDELRRVWRCLIQIKPKKRVVFVLHEIEGMSGPEIAQMLSISEATVRSRLHHARRELMAALAKEDR